MEGWPRACRPFHPLHYRQRPAPQSTELRTNCRVLSTLEKRLSFHNQTTPQALPSAQIQKRCEARHARQDDQPARLSRHRAAAACRAPASSCQQHRQCRYPGLRGARHEVRRSAQRRHRRLTGQGRNVGQPGKPKRRLRHQRARSHPIARLFRTQHLGLRRADATGIGQQHGRSGPRTRCFHGQRTKPRCASSMAMPRPCSAPFRANSPAR